MTVDASLPEMTAEQALDALRQLTEQVPLRWQDTLVRLAALEAIGKAVQRAAELEAQCPK